MLFSRRSPGRNASRYALFFISAAVLSGCAYVSQQAHLAPHPNVSASEIGHGTAVVVRVVDARSSTRIGYRGMDSQLSEITTEQDVPALVRKQIVDGLKAKGFDAREFDGQPSSRLLRVEVRTLEYTTSMEYLKGTVRTRAEFQVYFRKGDVLFSHLYQGEVKQPAVEAPRAKTNDMLINKALSEALESLLEDNGLLQFMATP